MTHRPLISALITTYNGRNFVTRAVESVLEQTFADFELVVVDDCSTDDTFALLSRYQDRRIRVIRTPTNLGVAGARNHGIQFVRGQYVAALDHDDCSLPTRLEKQVQLLESDPCLVLVSTSVLTKVANHAPAPAGLSGQLSPTVVRWLMYLGNPIVYSTIMFRTEAVLREGTFMRPEYDLADDYDLYFRLLRHGEFARINEPLVIYGYHGGNASIVRQEMLCHASKRVLAGALQPLFGPRAEEVADLWVEYIIRKRPVPNITTLDRMGEELELLLTGFLANNKTSQADFSEIRRHVGQLWWNLIRSGVRSGRPWLVFHGNRRPRLRSSFRPLASDVAISSAVGLVRMLKK